GMGDTPRPVSVLANDSDADGTLDPGTVTITASPTHGVLSVNASTGVVTYTPAANFFGSDSFRYTVKDNAGATSNQATVSIALAPVNDAPVAGDDAYTVAQGATLTVAAPGVLTNDTDVDGNALNATLVTTATHGTLTFDPNGSFTYTPEASFVGADTFTYRASDGTVDSPLATVKVVVTPSSTGPTVTLITDPV